MGSKILYAIIIFFSKMPFFILYRISDILYFVITYVIGYRKGVIMKNLRNSFPEKSEKELNRIRKNFNKNFSDQMIETLKMFTISKKELEKRLIIDNPEEITKWAKRGRSVMLAAGHYGNWEYPAGFPFTIPGFDQYNVIYAPVRNKFLNSKVLESREKFGCHLIPMKFTVREIITQPNHGQFYGFIFDQSPHKSKVKYDLHFLNQNTPVHLGTEQMAKAKNAVIVTAEVYKVKRGFYRAKVELLTDSPKEQPEYEITKKLFVWLEEIIKKEPALWLWSHRRWKYKRGKHYNL
ncbi:MAG: lysophospholipid acyltransferase family protein [Bacteroidota bacterium]